jgi:homocysteine S-methyltransferase
LEVHRRYLLAGAELLETNTFGANRFKLAAFGLEGRVADLNRAGVALAHQATQATGKPAYIAGAIGPLGVWIEPIGRVTAEKARQAYQEQVAALLGAGVDALLFETFSDINELKIAVSMGRELAPDLPLIAQMTFSRDDSTALGDSPYNVARALHEMGVDVMGVNCSGGPNQLLRLAGLMRSAVPDLLFAVQPNAGFPQQTDGRVAYPATPDYFGEYALAFREAGVRLIGGCCGTTPEHIHAMRQALDDTTRTTTLKVTTFAPEEAQSDLPYLPPTQLAQRLAEGAFITTVEVAPPRSFSPQKIIAIAEMLRAAGVNFLNISDSPLARMRMSPWAVSYLIQERLGMETVLHFPVRGRNLLRIQGDLLAAHAMNIRNIFVTMGDPNKIGDYPDSFDTHDVVPTGLISLIQQKFNAGLDHAGNSIEQPTRFNVGAALNLTPADIAKEVGLTRKKVENGANFLLTQPVFDVARAREFLAVYADTYQEALNIPIIAGLLPLYTPRHAAFLHNEVPGIEIPETLRERMEKASDPAAEGVRIAQEILLDLRQTFQGVYLMPPFGRYYLAAEVVEVLQTAHA